LPIYYKAKHIFPMKPSMSTPRYWPKRNGKRSHCLYTYLRVNIYGSSMHKHPKIETVKISFNRWMDNKQWYVLTMDYYPAMNKNKPLAQRIHQGSQRQV
jgi:hypothetical protein